MYPGDDVLDAINDFEFTINDDMTSEELDKHIDEHCKRMREIANDLNMNACWRKE